MKNDLLKCFQEKHGTPDNVNKLNEYVDFLLTYKLNETEYTENHHILDRASFPEFEKEEWNIITLDYKDHIKVHEMLFEDYNIRRYQRTLTFKGVKKDYKLLSNAAKKGWTKFKNNKVKYDLFCLRRSVIMKTLSSDEQSRRGKLFWDNLSSDELEKWKMKCNKGRTNESKIKQKESINIYYSNPDNREKKSKETKDYWDSLSESKRNDFRKNMKSINSNEDKRKDASVKIKNKWQDPVFQEKMSNRKTKPKNKYELIFEDGNKEIIIGFSEMIEKYNLNATLIRKFLNTKTKVESKSKREQALNTIGLIINQI